MNLKNVKTGQLVDYFGKTCRVIGAYNSNLFENVSVNEEKALLAIVRKKDIDFSRALEASAIIPVDCSLLSNISYKGINEVNTWVAKSLLQSQLLQRAFSEIVQVEDLYKEVHQLNLEYKQDFERIKKAFLLADENKLPLVWSDSVKLGQLYLSMDKDFPVSNLYIPVRHHFMVGGAYITAPIILNDRYAEQIAYCNKKLFHSYSMATVELLDEMYDMGINLQDLHIAPLIFKNMGFDWK